MSTQPPKGEPLSKFVARFMGTGRAEKTPKQRQRLAVAYSEAKRGAKRHG